MDEDHVLATYRIETPHSLERAAEVLAHPDGTAAGVRSMRRGWEAALAGTPLETYAADRPALAGAIAKFGRRAS